MPLQRGADGGCLGCSGDGAMSFLFQPEDPSDYGKPSTQCFVVVSHNAPLSAFYPDREVSVSLKKKSVLTTRYTSLSLSQWRGSKGSPRLWRLFNNRARTLADTIVYLMRDGVICQGAYAWVVAATEQRLSSSGQRTRPTMVSFGDREEP